jgi:hypothetical protein
MTRKILLSVLFFSIAGVAQAQQSGPGPGSGSDMYRVMREEQAMQRDGRYERLMEEARANKEAFDRLKQAGSEPTAVGSIAPASGSARPRRR